MAAETEDTIRGRVAPRKEPLQTRNVAEYPFKKVPGQFPERRGAPIVFIWATRGEST